MITLMVMGIVMIIHMPTGIIITTITIMMDIVTTHSHAHSHEDQHDHGGIESDGDNIHFGKGPAHAHVAGLSQSRMVQIEQDILGKNNQYAAQNRVRV